MRARRGDEKRDSPENATLLHGGDDYRCMAGTLEKKVCGNSVLRGRATTAPFFLKFSAIFRISTINSPSNGVFSLPEAAAELKRIHPGRQRPKQLWTKATAKITDHGALWKYRRLERLLARCPRNNVRGRGSRSAVIVPRSAGGPGERSPARCSGGFRAVAQGRDFCG